MKRVYDANEIQAIYSDKAKAFEWDEKTDVLHLLKAALITTHRCTLRCKLCAERTPYYKKRYHPTLEHIKKEIDSYFDLIDYTMKFDVTGGEPTMRKDLPEIMRYLIKYKEQFGRVRIVTIGTILFNKQLIDSLLLFGKQADVLIDDYGSSLSINAKQNSELLTKYNIIHILRKQSDTSHFGGWVDFGDLTLLHTEEEAKVLYRKCTIAQQIGFAFRMRGGLFSPCAMTMQCIELGAHEGNPNDYIDLFDNTMSKLQQRKKIQRIFEADYLSACMFCNGICIDSKRFRPAEQVLLES